MGGMQGLPGMPPPRSKGLESRGALKSNNGKTGSKFGAY